MRTLALTLAVIVAALSSPALAKKDKGAREHPEAGDAATLAFTEFERQLIREYFAEPGRAWPSNAKPLPPGIAKKLARGGELPPGIAKRYLPGELEVRLPRHARGERIVVGADVLLIEVATGIVRDVLRGVISR